MLHNLQKEYDNVIGWFVIKLQFDKSLVISGIEECLKRGVQAKGMDPSATTKPPWVLPKTLLSNRSGDPSRCTSHRQNVLFS